MSDLDETKTAPLPWTQHDYWVSDANGEILCAGHRKDMALFAAAPDLADAVEKALVAIYRETKHLDGHDLHICDELLKANNALEAVLAQARGEAS